MKWWLVFLFSCLHNVTVAQTGANENTRQYDPNYRYSVDKLREDFSFMRDTLEHKHPRLYEYTPKKQFDRFLDSLCLRIDHEMTEREFHFFYCQ